MWVRAYRGYNTVAIVLDDDYISYMPKKNVEQTANEGLRLFRNEKEFEDYFNTFARFQKETIAFFKRLLRSDISKSQAEKFLELCSESIRLYRKTEFIFTDSPYKEARKDNDRAIRKNLKKFENIKGPSRDYLNALLIEKESYTYRILEKTSEKFNVAVEDLLQYTPEECISLYEGKRVDKEITHARRKANIIIDDKGRTNAYWGEEAKEIIDDFLKDTNQRKELKGTIANKGKVVGHAKIIRPGYDDFHKVKTLMEKMNKGDILISETTSPEIMLACKKAGAIVTDQGGLMSHAVIVSRELGIPCIVGTENATQILQDGDLVEVDADKGIVKIVKKNV